MGVGVSARKTALEGSCIKFQVAAHITRVLFDRQSVEIANSIRNIIKYYLIYFYY